jgi:hypothetical protein
MKIESLLSQKSSSKTSSTADAEIFTLHGLLLAQKPLTKTRTHGRKSHPRSPLLRQTMTSSAQINYFWQTNPWWKLRPCCPKIHPRKAFLRLTLKFSMYIDYGWLRNRWRKLGLPDSKNHPRSQFYGRRWHLLRKWTTSDRQTLDENWVPAVPKFILETHFYSWRWNFQCT